MQVEEVGKAVEELLKTPGENQEQVMQSFVESQSPEEVALVLESLPPEERIARWSQIPEPLKLPVLVHMRNDPRIVILKQMTDDALMALCDHVDADTLLELEEALPDHIIDQSLDRMDAFQKRIYDSAQQYDTDSVGRWANHSLLVFPSRTSVKVVKRLLRPGAPRLTEVLYLATSKGKWQGCVSVSKIFYADDSVKIGTLKEEGYPHLEAPDDVYECAEHTIQSGFSALPVVSEHGMLLGRMDLYTAIEILKEKSENQMMASAGLDEEADLFGTVRKSAQNRAVWLGINLLTAFLASWFIGLFEMTLQQVVALAVLMPVVASMGGIAGSQTLTLIIRGLALGQINKANLKTLLIKEIKVGALNGVLWAIVIGIVASIWFSTATLGIVISLAIVINICAAALSGVLIPVLLDKLNLDPALSGSVILTTVTDIVGFVTFLGLGSLLLV
jgi:magnesium transporter